MERAASQQEFTVLLRAWGDGDQGAFDKLAPVVYDELRRLARRYMARERREHTLQPTALVHEAYLKLADFSRLEWKNRVHFFAIAAQVMRRVLVDVARARASQKRGTGQRQISLDDCLNLGEPNDAALIALDDSLTALAAADPRKCKVVEMKFFGGLSAKEIAAALGVSEDTVLRDWKLARLWLCREMASKAAE